MSMTFFLIPFVFSLAPTPKTEEFIIGKWDVTYLIRTTYEHDKEKKLPFDSLELKPMQFQFEKEHLTITSGKNKAQWKYSVKTRENSTFDIDIIADDVTIKGRLRIDDDNGLTLTLPPNLKKERPRSLSFQSCIRDDALLVYLTQATDTKAGKKVESPIGEWEPVMIVKEECTREIKDAEKEEIKRQKITFKFTEDQCTISLGDKVDKTQYKLGPVNNSIANLDFDVDDKEAMKGLIQFNENGTISIVMPHYSGSDEKDRIKGLKVGPKEEGTMWILKPVSRSK